MERPRINIIENQNEIINDNPNIDNWEAEQIMRKYGYDNQQFSTREEAKPVDNGLTFEEAVAQHEREQREERNRRNNINNGPKPITFSGQDGYDTETKYSSDDESGFGFKIQITTDMIIPKY